MEQKVSPATRPREISSRSSRDSRNAERTRGRGAKPPARFTSQRIAQVDRLRRREIDRSDSPAATARQISVFSSSLSRCTTHHLRSNKGWLVHRANALILRNRRTYERHSRQAPPKTQRSPSSSSPNLSTAPPAISPASPLHAPDPTRPPLPANPAHSAQRPSAPPNPRR